MLKIEVMINIKDFVDLQSQKGGKVTVNVEVLVELHSQKGS